MKAEWITVTRDHDKMMFSHRVNMNANLYGVKYIWFWKHRIKIKGTNVKALSVPTKGETFVLLNLQDKC